MAVRPSCACTEYPTLGSMGCNPNSIALSLSVLCMPTRRATSMYDPSSLRMFNFLFILSKLPAALA